MATDVDEQVEVETRTQPASTAGKPKPQPEYVVIIENDDDHTFDYVIEVLMRVCRLPLEKAYDLTRHVHLHGEALVWQGSFEVAELKRDQIRGFGPDFYASVAVKYPLGVRIEPLRA